MFPSWLLVAHRIRPLGRYENSLVHTEPKEFTSWSLLLHVIVHVGWGMIWRMLDAVWYSLFHTEPKDFIAWSLLLSMGWLQVAVHVCDLPILIVKVGRIWLANNGNFVSILGILFSTSIQKVYLHSTIAISTKECTSGHWSLISLRSTYYVNCPAI